MAARDLRISGDVFDRQLSRLVVATADEGDRHIDRAVYDVLRLMRKHLEMDVAFVSQFENGRRVFRYTDHEAPEKLLHEGASDPLEESFCLRVIDGRLPELVKDVAKLPDGLDVPAIPFTIGAHLSTPIVLHDGGVYGTFCCFSFAPNDELTQRDLGRLRMAAQMVARLIDQARQREER